MQDCSCSFGLSGSGRSLWCFADQTRPCHLQAAARRDTRRTQDPNKTSACCKGIVGCRYHQQCRVFHPVHDCELHKSQMQLSSTAVCGTSFVRTSCLLFFPGSILNKLIAGTQSKLRYRKDYATTMSHVAETNVNAMILPFGICIIM